MKKFIKKSIFVTGTDTDAGKTTVSAWLCMHTKADYWKPIQTGDDSDKDIIAAFSPHTRIIPEAYKLKAPLSPYDAANLENLKIFPDMFNRNVQNIVIEGAGGILVPIADNFCMVDMIKACDAAALVVVRSKLGMINHTLMTIEVLRNRNIDIVGIVISGTVDDYIQKTIEKFSQSKILAIIPQSNNLIETLRSVNVPPDILEIIG
jgi:dethiobiotin synthetase/malonyl-CoA O-methyltransferase